MSDSGAFRQAAGRFASGVTVVSTHGPAGAYGVTVSSFASLSLNPLLVTVSINRSSPLLEHVRAARHFAVSVLAAGQEAIAKHFARPGREPEPTGFAAAPSMVRTTGSPVIEGCLSWFDCTLEEALPGGDHEILVGRVAAAGGSRGEPLVYWAGSFRSLGQVPAVAGTAGSSSSLALDAAAELANAADGLSVALHLLGVGPVEMIDSQDAVEPALAGLAAQHGSTADWDRLDDLIAASELAVDVPEAFNELCLDAHNLIAEAAGNRILRACLISLRQVQSKHYRELGSARTARAAVQEHRELAAALRTGDAERAEHAMRWHLEQVRRRFGVDSS